MRKKLRGTVYKREGEKTAPSSLRATLSTIRAGWKNTGVSDNLSQGLTRDEFANMYTNSITESLARYSAKKTTPKSLVKKCILPSDHRDKNFLGYTDLRAFADIVGLPTGMLLLFSHALGDEYGRCYNGFDGTECEPEENARQLSKLFDTVITCMQIAKDEINEEGNTMFVLNDPAHGNDNPPYWGNIKLMERWSREFEKLRPQ